MIELEIFHHSDETASLKSLGVDYDISECLIIKMAFLKIDAISPYIENGTNYSSIHTNGSEYICNLNYNELKKRLLVRD